MENKSAHKRFDELTSRWGDIISKDLVTVFKSLQLIDTAVVSEILGINKLAVLKLPIKRIRLGTGSNAKVKFRIDDIREFIESHEEKGA